MTLWEKVVEFHGHACCILAVGYRAATLALEKLGPLAGDDRLAAVVETVIAAPTQYRSSCVVPWAAAASWSGNAASTPLLWLGPARSCAWH